MSRTLASLPALTASLPGNPAIGFMSLTSPASPAFELFPAAISFRFKRTARRATGNKEHTENDQRPGARAFTLEGLRAVLRASWFRSRQLYAAPTIIRLIRHHGEPCDGWLICTGWPLASPVVPNISQCSFPVIASRFCQKSVVIAL